MADLVRNSSPSRVAVVGSFNVDHVWRVAALPQPGATLGGEAITGVLLQNAFGEVVGHVSATYAAPPSRISLQALRNATPLWLATAAVMLALAIASVLAARWALKPQYRYLHDEQNTAMAQALASAQAVRTRMDDCITTLDESEASQ